MLIQFTPFVTRQRFAELVGVTEDTLERWIRDGRIPCFQMGKRSLVDLRAWLVPGPVNVGEFDFDGFERRIGVDIGAAAPARSFARTGAAAPRAATPPLSNTGINK